MAQTVRNPPAMRETWVRPLGWEDSLEKGMATHYSIPAWRIPMDRRAWQVGYSSWIAKSGTHRATKHSTAQQPTKHASPPPSLSLLPYPLSLHSLFPSLSPSLPLPLLPLSLPLSNAFSLLVLACIGDFKVIAF